MTARVVPAQSAVGLCAVCISAVCGAPRGRPRASDGIEAPRSVPFGSGFVCASLREDVTVSLWASICVCFNLRRPASVSAARRALCALCVCFESGVVVALPVFGGASCLLLASFVAACVRCFARVRDACLDALPGLSVGLSPEWSFDVPPRARCSVWASVCGVWQRARAFIVRVCLGLCRVSRGVCPCRVVRVARAWCLPWFSRSLL